ncbi:MAG: LysE family translocator [Sphingomonadales bacterium]|nr:LysE family translocator [Sphingomonadales bacterium]
MDLAALLIFAVALAIAAGTPGPNVAAIVARVITSGWQSVTPFISGLWLGEAVWMSLAVFGLAALAETMYWAFVAVKYAGVAYLLYLAWKMWTAPVESDADGAPVRRDAWPRMFLAGLALALGNPKIMVFYLALLPTIIDLSGVTLTAWAELTVTMLAILAAVDFAYVLLAARTRKLLKSPRALRLANRASATAMGGAAAAIATR